MRPNTPDSREWLEIEGERTVLPAIGKEDMGRKFRLTPIKMKKSMESRNFKGRRKLDFGEDERKIPVAKINLTDYCDETKEKEEMTKSWVVGRESRFDFKMIEKKYKRNSLLEKLTWKYGPLSRGNHPSTENIYGNARVEKDVKTKLEVAEYPKIKVKVKSFKLGNLNNNDLKREIKFRTTNYGNFKF